ncbi:MULTISPECIES: hypothetical protein [unclassified Streptomyces]|nr:MULTISPECIES: hypothetical protein [unclassified Streptomyces]
MDTLSVTLVSALTSGAISMAACDVYYATQSSIGTDVLLAPPKDG